MEKVDWCSLQPAASSQQPAPLYTTPLNQPQPLYWTAAFAAAQYSDISVRYIRGMNISIEITKSFMCHKIKFIPSLDLSAISIEWCWPGRGGAAGWWVVVFVPEEINVLENWEGCWWFIIWRKCSTLPSIFYSSSSFPPLSPQFPVKRKMSQQHFSSNKSNSRFIHQKTVLSSYQVSGCCCIYIFRRRKHLR